MPGAVPSLFALILAFSGAAQAPRLVISASVSRSLNITIRNPENRPVTISSRVEVELMPESDRASDEGYWSPVDLMRLTAARANESAGTIELAAKSEKRFCIPVEELRWAKIIAARWPEEPLADAVPGGRYVLRVRSNILSKSLRVAVTAGVMAERR